MSAEEIAGYAGTGEPLGKAGAYAIQGQAALFIEEIREIISTSSVYRYVWCSSWPGASLEVVSPQGLLKTKLVPQRH
jgi:hypothetical protein